MGFEPTYEELKHAYEELQKDYPIGCFEPTYEELKPSRFVFIFVFPQSFEPTYEELKHSSCFLPCFKHLCFEPTYEELKLNKLLASIHLLSLF